MAYGEVGKACQGQLLLQTGMGSRVRKWLAKTMVEDGVRKQLKVQETRP